MMEIARTERRMIGIRPVIKIVMARAERRTAGTTRTTIIGMIMMIKIKI